MPRMFDKSEKNLFGMKDYILKQEDIWLAEIGLLVVLMNNNGKDMDEVLKRIRDDKSVIQNASQLLIHDGFMRKKNESGEETIRVSDEPIFLEG